MRDFQLLDWIHESKFSSCRRDKCTGSRVAAKKSLRTKFEICTSRVSLIQRPLHTLVDGTLTKTIINKHLLHAEVVIFKLNISKKRCSKNMFEIETLAQVFSYEFCEISKNTFSYRTPPVAASDLSLFSLLVM